MSFSKQTENRVSGQSSTQRLIELATDQNIEDLEYPIKYNFSISFMLPGTSFAIPEELKIVIESFKGLRDHTIAPEVAGENIQKNYELAINSALDFAEKVSGHKLYLKLQTLKEQIGNTLSVGSQKIIAEPFVDQQKPAVPELPEVNKKDKAAVSMLELLKRLNAFPQNKYGVWEMMNNSFNHAITMKKGAGDIIEKPESLKAYYSAISRLKEDFGLLPPNNYITENLNTNEALISIDVPFVRFSYHKQAVRKLLQSLPAIPEPHPVTKTSDEKKQHRFSSRLQAPSPDPVEKRRHRLSVRFNPKAQNDSALSNNQKAEFSVAQKENGYEISIKISNDENRNKVGNFLREKGLEIRMFGPEILVRPINEEQKLGSYSRSDEKGPFGIAFKDRHDSKEFKDMMGIKGKELPSNKVVFPEKKLNLSTVMGTKMPAEQELQQGAGRVVRK